MSKSASSSAALPIAHVALRTVIVLNWLGGAAIAALLVAMPTPQWIRSALGVPPSAEAGGLIIGLHANAWALLALQLVSLVIGGIAKAVSTPAHPIHVDAGFSINGWLAV